MGLAGMWSARPVAEIMRRRGLGRPSRSLFDVAVRQWEITAGQETISSRAFYLPDQLERIIGYAFSPGPPRQVVEGGVPTLHGPTRGFLLRDVHLIDGTLYKGDASSCLHPRSSRFPQLRVAEEVERGAVYCTFTGNRYFGQWLLDDCATYPLAEAEGIPVTTAHPIPCPAPGRVGHTLAYERWFDMKPHRLHSAVFRELVIFDDVGQNVGKRDRFRRLGKKLLEHVDAKPHPGVFIIRGKTGERRVLKNELEIAERLRSTRGFRVVDIATADVPTLVATCAGARVVVGVEGSHLLHGIILLPPGGAVLTLQPPKRFCPILKELTDRDEQHFGFVVGSPDGEDSRIDVTEVERTLDLFPVCHDRSPDELWLPDAQPSKIATPPT
jgi:hypothetical protein